MAQQVLIDKDGTPCPWCLQVMDREDPKRMPTKDHLHPRSRARHVRNSHRTLVVCSECNFLKADMTLREYVVSLDAKNKALEQFIQLNKERIENIAYLLKIGIEE